jgi:hypothetical protein
VVVLTFPGEITRKLMKQFERQQAENCGIEWKEREPGKAYSFLNWNPIYEQQKANPGKLTQ